MRRFVPVAFALLMVPAPSPAATPGREPTLVTTAWLARHLGDPDLVVLHAANQRADYDAGHVPGARFLGWASFTTRRDSLSVELPAAARLDSLLGAAGVTGGSRLVIAGGPVTVSARLLVTLDHLGLGDRASILDGGIDAWRAEGRPVSRDSSLGRAGNLAARTASKRIVDAAWVSEHAGDSSPRVAIVDARTTEYHQGLASNNDPRSGRLPGARNVPFNWLTREFGRFREPRELQRLFANAGVKRGDRVVTYCHIGIQACVAYVAARSLGYEVAMYDGSFEDWSRQAGRAIESGPPPVR